MAEHYVTELWGMDSSMTVPAWLRNQVLDLNILVGDCFKNEKNELLKIIILYITQFSHGLQ